MHECENCGFMCDCDGEDHGQPQPADCECDCCADCGQPPEYCDCEYGSEMDEAAEEPRC